MGAKMNLMERAKKLADTIMDARPEGASAKWSYDTGLLLAGFEALYRKTGEEKYMDYVKKYFSERIDTDGTIKDYKPEAMNLDNINCGKNLFNLYRETGDERYRVAIETLAEQLRRQPKTESGAYWHKKIYPHQIWLDGVFMAEPFSARYAMEFHHPENYDWILTQFQAAEKSTFDARTGLYVHGCDESKTVFWADPHTGKSLNVWGRACGWYSMAIVDVLDYVPEQREDVCTQLIANLNKLMEGVIHYQDDDGVWYQVLDSRHVGNYQEASCTCQFAYTLEKAIRLGYLSREKYGAALEKAIKGIENVFYKEDETGAFLVNCCAVSGLGPAGDLRRDGTLSYYFSEPVVKNDYKAVGPLLLLAASRA